MPLEREMPVQFQVVQLPSGHHLCKVRALNKGDANSEVTVYYQVSWPHRTAGLQYLGRVHPFVALNLGEFVQLKTVTNMCLPLLKKITLSIVLLING